MKSLRVDQFADAVASTAAGARALALLSESGEQLTYADLAARIAVAARALEHAGLGAGQRAVLVGENTVDMIVVLLAVMRLRAWAVPLNARMSASEIDGICAHCAPRLAYFSSLSPDAAGHAARQGATAVGQDGLLQGLVGGPCTTRACRATAATMARRTMWP
jgi:acyl-CoA synthetase (AMP-forming)/AMP-acid ligase II